jgi:hypothetical protein
MYGKMSLFWDVMTWVFYAAMLSPSYIMIAHSYLKKRAKQRAGITPQQFAGMKEVKDVLKSAKPKTPADVLQILNERVFPSGYERRNFFYDGMWKHKFGSGKYEHEVSYYYWSLPQFPRWMVVIATYEYGKVKIEVKMQDDKPQLTSKLPTEVEA